MTASDVTLPKSFPGGNAGGCVLLFCWAFMIPMAFGAFQSLTQEAGFDPTTVAALVGMVWLAASVAIYVFFDTMTIITVDRHGLTVAHQRGLGPIRGRTVTEYEILWSSVSEVRDVEQRRLTKHGNVSSSFRFEIGDKVIHSAHFGTMSRDGRYAEFLEAVRSVVGERLVTKEDLGELEAPLRRLIDQRISARQADGGPTQGDGGERRDPPG